MLEPAESFLDVQSHRQSPITRAVTESNPEQLLQPNPKCIQYPPEEEPCVIGNALDSTCRMPMENIRNQDQQNASGQAPDPATDPGGCTAQRAGGSQVSCGSRRLLSGPETPWTLSPKVWVQVFHSEGPLTSPGLRQEVRCSWEYDSLALFLPDWDDSVWFQFNPNALQ